MKTPKPERLHGRHVLNRYEDGMEKCIGCELCAGVCPARCIYVRGADNPRRRPGLARASATATSTRSTTCAASTATSASRPAPPRPSPRRSCSSSPSPTASDAIYTKAELLVDDDGKPRQLPWEDWREGDDQHTSGWMRATAPSGDAAFEGEVAWSGELGYGVRAAGGGPVGAAPTRTSRRPLAAAASTHLTPGEAAHEQAHDDATHAEGHGH